MGMESAHAQASGMGGMRTAGDLVARMQMTRRMRLKEAKAYVADKLGCGSPRPVRSRSPWSRSAPRRGSGLLPHTSAVRPGDAGMIEAKFNIARTLDIPINCVERFKERAGL